jgi:uncharacterized coiled-coil protein SlyX
MGCNNNQLVLVSSAKLAKLEALVASQQELISELECRLSQLTSKSKAVQAKKIIKQAKTKCYTEPSCGC